MSELEERYQAILERIQAAEQSAGRTPGETVLVAVTKTWPVETILAAYAAGMRHFGENRPEELAEKRPLVEAELGRESGITWHLIGPLQSRKTQLAADHAHVFHALDRLKIARRLSKQVDGRDLPVFLEINVSGEGSKAGFAADKWEEDSGQRSHLRDVVATLAALPRIDLQGLMTMAPWDAPAPEIRRVFGRTRALSEWLAREVPDVSLGMLSMGMTDDFELAIAEGATHVRIGRAIFGEREQ